MDGWSVEITELHQFFEDLFCGRATSLDRVEAALAHDFTIVGPSGVEASRADTMAMLAAARDQAGGLSMSTSDHTLVLETSGIVVASYVEHHHQPEGDTHRLSTVVFTAAADAPNGVHWLRVHETWSGS